MASSVVAWPPLPGGVLDDLVTGALWLRRALQGICDATMPRARAPGGGRRSVYWWWTEIADLRAVSLRARRQYTKARRWDRRRITEDRLQELRSAFSAPYKELRGAIVRAKTRSCDEFLATLNQDPWGCPYRAVSIKLGPWAPPVTEGLESRLPLDVLSALFPPPPVPGEGSSDESGDREFAWGTDIPDAPRVAEEELACEVQQMRSKNAAPGPDGVPGRVWVCAMSALGDGLRREFDAALRTGRSPPPPSPPRVEGSEVGAAPEARKTRRVTLGIPPAMSPGRGGQAAGTCSSCPPPGPPGSRRVPGSFRPPIRL